MDVSCFVGAVGLSRVSCPCDAPPPDSFDSSDSGLFITDLAPLGSLEGFDDCSGQGVWGLLSRARDQAIREFVGEVSGLMSSVHRLKRVPFSGAIGMAERRGNVSTGMQFRGIRIASPNIRGGYMRITAIGTHFTSAGTLDINIVDRMGNVLHTIEVSTDVARHKVTALNSVIELPLFDPYSSTGPEYLFAYNSSTAPGSASDNRIFCGCKGTFSANFDTARPYYFPSKHAPTNDRWVQWVMAGGWDGDSLDSFANAGTTGQNRGYGLTLDVQIGCRPSEVLCAGSLNFHGNALAMSIAMAIQHKAAINAAQSLLAGEPLTRQNLINRDALPEAVQVWSAKYNEYVQFIAANADTDTNDCLECRGVVEMATKGIFA